jgi:hypothetical protein
MEKRKDKRKAEEEAERKGSEIRRLVLACW